MKILSIKTAILACLLFNATAVGAADGEKYMMRFGTSMNLLPDPGLTSGEGPTTPPVIPQSFSVAIADINAVHGTMVVVTPIVSGPDAPYGNLEFSYGNLGTPDAPISATNKKTGRFVSTFYAERQDFDSNQSPAGRKPYVQVKNLLTGETVRKEFRIVVKSLYAAPVWSVKMPDVYVSTGQPIYLKTKPELKKNGTYYPLSGVSFSILVTVPGVSGANFGYFDSSVELGGLPTSPGIYTVTVWAKNAYARDEYELSTTGVSGTFKIHVSDDLPSFRYYRLSADYEYPMNAGYLREIIVIDKDGHDITPRNSSLGFPSKSNVFISPRAGLGNGISNIPQEVMICGNPDCTVKMDRVSFEFDFGPVGGQPKRIDIYEGQPDGYNGWQPFHDTLWKKATAAIGSRQNYDVNLEGSHDGVTWADVSSISNTDPSSYYGVSKVHINGFKFD